MSSASQLGILVGDKMSSEFFKNSCQKKNLEEIQNVTAIEYKTKEMNELKKK